MTSPQIKEKNVGSKKSSLGFTLIEVIVSLVVVALLGTMVMVFMDTAVPKSAQPLLHVQNGNYLNQVMENITADYKALRAESSTPLDTLKENINKTADNPYITKGKPYTIVEIKRIDFDPDLAEKDTENSNILKVTLTYEGLSLTALFAQ